MRKPEIIDIQYFFLNKLIYIIIYESISIKIHQFQFLKILKFYTLSDGSPILEPMRYLG